MAVAQGATYGYPRGEYKRILQAKFTTLLSNTVGSGYNFLLCNLIFEFSGMKGPILSDLDNSIMFILVFLKSLEIGDLVRQEIYGHIYPVLTIQSCSHYEGL